MARRGKSHGEEHENTERWLVSYADFITLLFAFFVVMYSLSSVNEGKYRILSNSLMQAFRNVPVNAEGQNIVTPPVIVPGSPAVPIKRPDMYDKRSEAREQAARKMRGIASDIRRILGPLTGDGKVRVTEGAFGVTVEINASVLFSPGEAILGREADTALRAVGTVIADAEFPILVEGHTDNNPISTLRFPSNWELSSARASSVVRLFIENGVSSGRLTAAGYADQRPIADNGTDAGRARNRRVAIMLESRVAVDEPESEPEPEPEPESATKPETATPDAHKSGIFSPGDSLHAPELN
ncbi:MAG: flagellar motor protein MotD [Azoarcus sp.]|jgi:chemotaxis protein MotB|nr:flagellar motor protein MotD [Azoarcus sp.]